MSNSNNTITSPNIDFINDVKTVLGESNNDLGALCTSENINFWAKYRPSGYGTRTGRPTKTVGGNTVPNYRLSYGFTKLDNNNNEVVNDNVPPKIYVDSNGVCHIESVSGSTDLTWNISNITPWRADLPASKKFYRIVDFDNYCHIAVCPYQDTSPSGNIIYNITSTILSFEKVSGNNSSLTLDDVLIFDPTYSPYYFGVLIKRTRNSSSNFYLLRTGCPINQSGSYTGTGIYINYENGTLTLASNLSLLKDTNNNNLFEINDICTFRLVLVTSSNNDIYNVPMNGDFSNAVSFTLTSGFCVRSASLVRDYSYVSRTVIRAAITSPWSNVYLKKITDTSIIDAIKVSDPTFSQLGSIRVCQLIFDKDDNNDNCIKAGIKVKVDNVHWADDDQRNSMDFNTRKLKIDIKNQSGAIIGDNKWIVINTNTAVHQFTTGIDFYIGSGYSDSVIKSNGNISCCGESGNTSNLPIIFNNSFNSNDIFGGITIVDNTTSPSTTYNYNINDDDIYIVCPSDFDSDTNTLTVKYFVDDELKDTEWLDVNN